MTVLGEMTHSFCELKVGRLKELSESVRLVLLTLSSGGLFFAEKGYNGGGPDVESSQTESFGFHWRSTGDKAATDEGTADGETGIVRVDFHSAVKAFRQILLEKKERGREPQEGRDCAN